MTDKEKARAYDEALEKAKEIKEKIMSSHLSTESRKAVSEYIDTIIPELAESEDEEMFDASLLFQTILMKQQISLQFSTTKGLVMV